MLRNQECKTLAYMKVGVSSQNYCKQNEETQRKKGYLCLLLETSVVY